MYGSMMSNKIRHFALGLCALPLLCQADGLLSVDNPAKNTQDHKVYASAQAFEGNDQVAMRQYGAQWQGDYSPRNDTNIGLLSARTESGLQWDGFRFGALYRAEALVQTNRDSSDLVQQYNNRQGYDIGRAYLIDYQIKGFEAYGARLSKSLPFNLGSQWALNVGIGVSYLHGKSLKLETATGQVITLNAKDFDANVTTIDTNSSINTRDRAYFNAPYGRQASPSGQGYAIDAGLLLRDQNSGFSAELAVADLAGRINWQDVPNHLADYKTATKYYDSDGFVRFNPIATSVSSYQNVNQSLEPKVWLALNYAFQALEIQSATSYTAGFWFPQAGIKYHLNPKWVLGADYDFRFNTLGVLVQHQWLHFGVKTDNSNLASAKAYGVTAGISVPF